MAAVDYGHFYGRRSQLDEDRSIKRSMQGGMSHTMIDTSQAAANGLVLAFASDARIAVGFGQRCLGSFVRNLRVFSTLPTESE